MHIFALTIIFCVGQGTANADSHRQLRTTWGDIDTTDATYVFKVSPNFTPLSFYKINSTNILISVNFSELNATLDFIIHTIKQVALRRREYLTPRELWLSFTPRGDIHIDLDIAIAMATSVNQISAGTITTILIDYGLLQLTPTSRPLVQDDLRACRVQAGPSNLRCGLIIDSINCLTSIDHITKLGLQSGNIFIVHDGIHSFRRNSYLLHNIRPCLWSLKGTDVSLGYKMDLFFNNTFNRTPEIVEEDSTTPSASRGKRDIRKEDELILKLDYVVTEVFTLGNRQLKRKFNPIQNMDEWLRRSADFDKNLFGVSIHSSNTFLVSDDSVLTSLFQQFPTILVEIDDMTQYVYDAHTFMRQIVHVARNEFNSVLKFALIMNIYFDDFQLNKQYLDHVLSIAAAGNVVYPNSVKTIFINWAVPLRKNVTLSAKKFNVSGLAVDRYLDQAKALYRVLTYLDGSNITDVRFGVLWEMDIIDQLLHSEDNVDTLRDLIIYLGMLPLQRVILKLKISLDDLSFEDLLHTSRTVIYMLTSYIDTMRGSPSETFPSHDVGVYIGIVGCSGGQYDNLSNLTDYLLFWEVIQTWAMTKNVSVYINTAFETEQSEETMAECEWKYFLTGRTPCMCGWWHVSNKSTLLSKGKELLIEDKKSMARRLYAQAQKPQKEDDNRQEDRQFSKHKNMRVTLIAVSVVLGCALLGLISVAAVIYHRSRNAISFREVQNFLFGSRDNSTRESTNDGSASAHGRGYNKELYEVSPSSFSIDFDCQLGQGEFASVYQGVIKKAESTHAVAVKMKSGKSSADTQRYGNYLALKSIISEIKILSYVEDHPNIVKLEAAYTAKLRKGTVIVFLELCPLGSLDKHLRTYNHEDYSRENSTLEISDVGNNTSYGANGNGENLEFPLPMELKNDLAKWSKEIACGMEFLMGKKLVHADLAARNVLLDATKTAKISDFGLSRRLYDYPEYLKKERASLPWRWMAPESLRKLVFNVKTDVWAFGVTLWEMYTLGDLPYPGLSYHINFAALLTTPTEIGRVRLAKPKYAFNKIYEVMQRCWEVHPGDRPDFETLHKMLTDENSDVASDQ